MQREQRKNALSPRLGFLKKTLLEPKEPGNESAPRRSLDLADREQRIMRSEAELERMSSSVSRRKSGSATVLTDFTNKLREVESLAKEHEEAQSQIDSLYETIFAGPSAFFRCLTLVSRLTYLTANGFPEEDDAELEVLVLEKELAQVSRRRPAVPRFRT
jgi:hypothetical protein